MNIVYGYVYDSRTDEAPTGNSDYASFAPAVIPLLYLTVCLHPSLSLWPKKSHFTNEKFRLISKHHNLDSTHSLAHNVNVAHYALHFRHPNRKHNLIQFILFALFLPLCTSSHSL